MDVFLAQSLPSCPKTRVCVTDMPLSLSCQGTSFSRRLSWTSNPLPPAPAQSQLYTQIRVLRGHISGHRVDRFVSQRVHVPEDTRGCAIVSFYGRATTTRITETGRRRAGVSCRARTNHDANTFLRQLVYPLEIEVWRGPRKAEEVKSHSGATYASRTLLCCRPKPNRR